MNDAGRIGFVIKGDYSSSTQYEFLDVVYYNNATYVAKTNVKGVAPTDITKWFCAMDADINGLVHACTVNPNATADYAADWLLEDGVVVTPGTNDLYRVVVGGKDRLFFWNGSAYEIVSGGGHTIQKNVNGSILPMAGRDNLQFENVKVLDDSTNNTTIIKPQFHVCPTEAEWNQMTDAEKNDPLVYWVRPWANSDAFATDRTPVGTVVSVAGTYNYTTHTPTGRFPSNDYLVCNGATIVDGKNVSKQTFPKLAEYFQEAYGNFQYFGTGGGGTNEFSLPNWELDFPENGILCIKAQISSTAITFAEVDDTGIYAGEDKVPSCARVAALETVENITLTAQPGVTSLQYCAKKISNLVLITGRWVGSVSGNAGYAVVSNGYRPSNTIQGSGIFYDSSGTPRVGMSCDKYGLIYQNQTGATIEKGDFTFIYTI